MAYLITANDKPRIEFAPQTTAEEVLQNVRTILTTVKYQIPLARDFGISGEAIDMPIQRAQAFLSNEIFMQVKKYEPRAIIESISFSADITGKIVPTLEVKINETG